MSYEAIILAGGFGTRLRSVVNEVPKPMASIGGRPFLCYLMELLRQQGYRRLVLATGYLHEKVEAYFGTEYGGMEVAYARETHPLGTGGAMVNALQHCTAQSVTILNGDTLFLADLQRLHRVAAERHAQVAIVLREVPNAGRYGAVETNAEGRITAFREKDASAGAGLINGGIYQVERRVLEGYSIGEAFSFERDVLQQRYARQPFYAVADTGYFVDIGIPEDYQRAQQELPALHLLHAAKQADSL